MYSIDTATLEEVELAVAWAAREGWNPGFSDARAFYAQDPGGFFMGKLRGEPLGCISCVKYPWNFAFIGFYIVRPECRRKGYGLRLWKHALEYGSGCSLGLDGVPAQQENYAKSGFQLAYRNIRWWPSTLFISGDLAGSFCKSGLPWKTAVPWQPWKTERSGASPLCGNANGDIKSVLSSRQTPFWGKLFFWKFSGRSPGKLRFTSTFPNRTNTHWLWRKSTG